jgi:PRC-barrel domain
MDRKIGEIVDFLVDPDGKIEAFIISVGGFVGIASQGRRPAGAAIREISVQRG